MPYLTSFVLLSACVEPDAGCVTGLDADADGVCDRQAADWSASAQLAPGEDRHNIYDLDEDALAEVTAEGLVIAGAWPVEISGVMLPSESFSRLLEPGTTDPGREDFQTLARSALGFGDMEEMADWLGLARYPADGSVPLPEGVVAGDPMGMGAVQTEWGPAFSVSCHACHATEMFGKVVVGLTNRRTRANEYFQLASTFFPLLTPEMYQDLSGATAEELALFERAQARLPAVGGTLPLVHGLDTSLAQVSLSLARREADAWSSLSPAALAAPRARALDDAPADSKPAVWWTLRHKTRWLSDGSVVSGNPIFTNFLWNEVGRGTDLHDLDTWLQDNGRNVDALTVAVFNTPSPRWADHLPGLPIDDAAAARGATVYATHCASCHGLGADYSRRTEVVDVGTDAWRAEGMADFADDLNGLVISQDNGTVVEVQAGYVPPPLDGIWARFPYLHNGSVPTLCDLLRQPEDRPTTFVVGPPDDPDTDFDAACVGIPTVPPDAWLDDPQNVVDTTRPGLGNQGHVTAVPEGDVADLVEFLKTL